MIHIDDFIENFSATFKDSSSSAPWEITNDLKNRIEKMISNLSDDFVIENNIAIHKTAVI